MAANDHCPAAKIPRPRWLLHMQAQMWRTLMSIGMFLHKVAPPRPPNPSFQRTIPTAVSPSKGSVRIQFYVPSDYEDRIRRGGEKFPVVVNFHGGGFTLGTATDDARWAAIVVEEVGAIVASVDYRRAPEYPFPTAVEDGVDAVMYIAAHAQELYIDTDKIGVSGFSSGGNMAFTVPLRMQEELSPVFAAGRDSIDLSPNKSVTDSRGDSVVQVLKETRVAAIVAWYPSLDYTVTREQRRATNVRKDQELSAIFTELFDESYLQPPTMDMSSPFLSPGVAPQAMLNALPDDIILYTCEWDMLRAEGERLRDRLQGLGKSVHYSMVSGVPHGWDKAPNPLNPTPGVQNHYLDACKQLKAIFQTEN